MWGWHAFSETLRAETDKQKPLKDNSMVIDESLNIPSDTTFITGGTCAAMRSVGVMHTLGFRRFHLFGFDCNVDEPKEEQQKEMSEENMPKYIWEEVQNKLS